MTPEEIQAALDRRVSSAIETFNRSQPGVFGQAQPVFIDDAQPAGPMPEPQEDLRSQLLTELDAMGGIHTQSVKDRGNGTWGDSVEFVSASPIANPEVDFGLSDSPPPADYSFFQGSTAEPVTADFQTDSPSPANSADGFELTVAPVLPQSFHADVQFSDSVSPKAPDAQFTRMDVAASLPKVGDIPFPTSQQPQPTAVPPMAKPVRSDPAGQKVSPQVRRNQRYLQQYHERRARANQPQAIQKPQSQVVQGSPESPQFEMQSHYAWAATPEASPAKIESDQPEPVTPQPAIEKAPPEVQVERPAAFVSEPAWKRKRQSAQPSSAEPVPQPEDQAQTAAFAMAEEHQRTNDAIARAFRVVSDSLQSLQSQLRQITSIIDRSIGD